MNSTKTEFFKKIFKKIIYKLKLFSINVQNYFQLISSYKIPMQKEKTLTQILV